MPDDLVRRRGAVDHEKGMVGAEITRCALLGSRQRPGMIEQRTQLRHRHRQVGTQGVFAEKLVKRLTYRALAIGHTTAVTGGVPGIVGLGGVMHQRLEKRRQQAIQVIACGARHLPSEKGHGVFVQIKNAAQVVEVVHGLNRRILDGHLLTQSEDRQIRCTHTGHTNQLNHVLQQVAIFPCAFGGHQNARQAMVGGRNNAPLGGAGTGKNAEAVLLQLAGNGPHAITGHGVGLDVTVHNKDGEF